MSRLAGLLVHMTDEGAILLVMLTIYTGNIVVLEIKRSH